MGATATDTLTEIEATRAKLDDDLRVLQSRVPSRDELLDQVKEYGTAYGPQIGAGAAAVGLTGLVASRAARNRRLRKDAERQAAAFAKVLPGLLPEAIPVEARVEHTSSKTGPVALFTSAVALGLAGFTFWNSTRGQEVIADLTPDDAPPRR